MEKNLGNLSLANSHSSRGNLEKQGQVMSPGTMKGK